MSGNAAEGEGNDRKRIHRVAEAIRRWAGLGYTVIRVAWDAWHGNGPGR